MIFTIALLSEVYISLLALLDVCSCVQCIKSLIDLNSLACMVKMLLLFFLMLLGNYFKNKLETNVLISFSLAYDRYTYQSYYKWIAIILCHNCNSHKAGIKLAYTPWFLLKHFGFFLI